MEESVRHLYYNSPNMRKTLLASCRSQFLLDRLGKCLKLFVSTVGTSCHKFASQYGLEMFLYAKLGPKTTPNTGCCAAARQRIVCRSRSFSHHCVALPVFFVMFSPSKIHIILFLDRLRGGASRNPGFELYLLPIVLSMLPQLTR